MNPLKNPWSCKKKPVVSPASTMGPRRFLGVRTEVREQSKETPGPKITIEVRAIQSGINGLHVLLYQPGQQLRHYLRALKILKPAMHAGMYDQAHLEHGRLRIRYVVQPDSHILISPGALGIAGQYQRVQVDVYDLMKRMK
jgi:hypothetical protein